MMTIGTDRAVDLRDQRTGEAHHFPAGPRALWHALGVLAEWRERDELRGNDVPDKAHYGVPDDTQCDVFPGLACTPKREQCQTFCIRNGPQLPRNPDYVASERETMRPDGTWTRGPVPEIARLGHPRDANVYQCWNCSFRTASSERPVIRWVDGVCQTPGCGVSGGMPHDCETAGRIS
ncbi:MAG: hypothetical protein ABWY81_06085 [Jiangellaceae bacterium]